MTFPKLNYHNKIIIVSSAILAISALLLSSIIGWLLYTAVFDEEAKRLVEIVHNQAQLMEAVARFDAQYSAQDVDGGAVAATLSQIAEAHKHYQGFGKTGEVVLAWREGDKIAFILSQRNFDLDKPTLIPWSSPLAEPMRLALQGESGTVIGLDYRGQSVLAAYQPISILNLGIVAKIDMAEIRAPFIDTGMIAIGITFLIILIGVFAFQRLVNPIILRMEESEERFRALFEGSLDALFLIEPKNRQVLDANPTASQLLLKSRQEIVGNPESQLYPSSADISDPPTDHSFNNQEKDNICAHIETVALRSDGSTIPVEVITHLIQIHGQPVIQSVFRDITAQKQAHEALIQSQQRYKNLVNSIDGIVWEADAKTFQFTFISQQAERFFGYPLQDWLNQPSFWAEHIHPDDKTWAPTYCAESTANQRDHDFEYRMITADQRTLWIRDLVTVIVENDQAVKLCGIMLDVTDKKADEEKIAIFQRFIETSGEGMGMTTLDGKVVYMNPSLCRFVDEPDLKTVFGRKIIDFYPEAQQKRFQAEFMPKILETGQWAGEMNIISSNGKITQTYESFFLIKDNEEQPLYLAVVISNITDIKRTQEALKKANLALTALTECRQVLFHAQDEQTMFQEICQVLVEQIGYRLVWIGFAEADANQTVRPVAQYGYEDGYLDNISISWGDNEFGQGPTGTAIRAGKPSIAAHIQTDPKYAPWRPQAQQRGYASSMAVPILLQQKAIGAINIYAAEPNAFDTDIIKLFEKLSADMTYGMTTMRTRVDRQRAEQELRQSEERFRKMFEDGPIGMVISDSDNRLLQVNTAFCQMLGYTEAELLGMTVTDLSHPEDMSQNLELRQQMLNGDIPFVQMEKRYLSKDGQVVWGNLAVSVFKTGDILYHLGKVEDITERKRAEEQLRKLSTAIEQSPSIVVITDTQARIEYVNPKFCQITGYTLKEAIGQTPNLFKSGQQSSAFYQNMWQTILSGNDWRSELQNKKKNGTLYWELASISPLKNQGKAVTHFIKVAEDITERKQAEDQLRASEKRFRKIFEDAPLGMVIVGYYLKIIQVNKAFYQMLGYSESEPLIGATIIDISASEDIPKTKEMMMQLYRGEISSFRMEKRYRQQDGTLVWGNTSVSFFYDQKGQPLYFMAMIENITERKQTEQALRKSESMLARAQEIAHLGNWEWDIKTNQQIWSDENYRLLGYQPGAIEASFDHFMNLVHPEDRSKVAAIGQAFLEGQSPPNYYESRIIRTDGTERILQSQMLCDFDETGQPIRITGVSLDVTERQRAEQQLNKLTERLSSIVDSLPVVPYTCQTEGVFATTYVGKNVTAVSGYQPKEFTSNPSFWSEHIHPDDRERVFKNIPKLLKNGYYEHEYRFKVADGRYKWFGDTVRVINNAEGVMTHIAGVWQNITERKQAEASLRESETRIRTLVENMVDGVVTIDENGIIESFNPAAMTIFGYSAEEVIGKNVKILMPEPYRHEHDGYLEHYKSTGIAQVIGKGREVKGQHQNGSTFPLDLAVSEMWIGEQRKFVGIVRNITERKQFEEALKKAIESAEAANRAKSEFLANMSHEIRTPMNAVIGFSELLSSLTTDKQQKSYLDSIQTAGKSLLTLINDILDLSKIEAGRLDIQYEVVNPLLIFNELQQIFAIKIAEKNLEFIVDIDKQLPLALSLDEVRLRQVLLNLIGNAIKFTDKGYIKLTAKMSPSQKATAQNIMEGTAKPIQSYLLTEKVGDLILTVEDTGIGIPENQQAMIFESFRQQEGQSTRKYGGTGLGLAITKRLVEMMNGQISVKSTAAQGSVFEIILREIQVSSIESVQTDQESFDFKNISFKKAQVLVVDDIESNRTLINEYLSKVNLDVVEAADGQKGLLFAQEYRPNLILMDIRMPEMDGYEATRQLKENPTTQKIPVIALTASVTVDEKANVMAHGFDGYLSKPVSTHALFNELTHYLKHTKKPTKPQAAMDDKPSLLLETWIELPVLLQTLEEKILPKWQEIIDMIETDAVDEFAKQLINLGNKHHASILIDYATKLRDKAQEFDIDGVERTLEEFPAILDRIKT